MHAIIWILLIIRFVVGKQNCRKIQFYTIFLSVNICQMKATIIIWFGVTIKGPDYMKLTGLRKWFFSIELQTRFSEFWIVNQNSIGNFWAFEFLCTMLSFSEIWFVSPCGSNEPLYSVKLEITHCQWWIHDFVKNVGPIFQTVCSTG